jgi:hypothetical protein
LFASVPASLLLVSRSATRHRSSARADGEVGDTVAA